MSHDRRVSEERRILDVIDEPLDRSGERRSEERRDSPRVSRRLWVVHTQEGGTFHVHDGEVSLEGASFKTPYPPKRDMLEVRFRLPTADNEFVSPAKVIARHEEDGQTRVQVIFEDTDALQALALAKYLQRT